MTNLPLSKTMFNVFDNEGKVHYYKSKREYLGRNSAVFSNVNISSREYTLGESSLLFKGNVLLNGFNGEEFSITYRSNKTIVYVSRLLNNSFDVRKEYESIFLIIDYVNKTIRHNVNGEDITISSDFTVEGVLSFVLTDRFNKTYNILKLK